MPENTETKEIYVEYKGNKFPVKDGNTKEDVAAVLSNHFPELSNHQLIAKESDPNGFVIQPKTGGKG